MNRACLMCCRGAEVVADVALIEARHNSRTTVIVNQSGTVPVVVDEKTAAHVVPPGSVPIYVQEEEDTCCCCF